MSLLRCPLRRARRTAAPLLAAALAMGLIAPTVASSEPAPPAMKSRAKTIDFVYDARDTGHLDEGHEGRVFLAPEAIEAAPRALPLVVFLHGVNARRARFRMMGGRPDELDLRIVVGSMMARKALPPVILAAPTTEHAATIPLGMWPHFDLDRFVARTAHALRGKATIDLDRVVVVGHSAGGCNPTGGLHAAAASTSLRLRAAIAVDTCMNPVEATRLAAVPPHTDVVVTYQTASWRRPFDAFSSAFAAVPPPPHARRILDQMPASSDRHAHNMMVARTLEKYLPIVISPAAEGSARGAVAGVVPP